MSHTLLVIIFALLLLPGIIGVVLPILPGIPYMFIIALVFGFLDHFQHLRGSNITILAVITVLSIVVDYLSGVLGAKYSGASKRAIFAGLIGFIIGFILFPPFGGIAGLFLAVLIAELSEHQNHKRALKAASGSLIGSLTGIAINIILALTFITLFIVFTFK